MPGVFGFGWAGLLFSSAVVIVATVKALRLHGGSPDGTASSPEESMSQLRAGIANLAAHIRTAKGFGMPCIVAVNRFPADTDEEVELVRTLSLEAARAPPSSPAPWSRPRTSPVTSR